MKRIFRVGIVAAVALAAGVASAANPVGKDNEREYEVNVIGMDNSAAQNEFEKQCGQACKDADKDPSKAYVIRVEGDLKLKRGELAQQALQKLIQKNVKIAILCNCPDFEKDYPNTTFWELKDSVFGSKEKRYTVTLDGNGGQCLDVDSQKSRSEKLSDNNVGLIYGMTFISGKAHDGGGVDARGSMRFVRCTFKDCQTTRTWDGYGGGAIYFPPEAKYAKAAFTPSRFGSNLDEMTQVSCSFCTFENCHSENNGGAIYTQSAIFTEAGRYGSIADCIFRNCDSKGDGGALNNVETVVRSMFLDCKTNGGSGYGGAIYQATEVSGSLFVGVSAADGFGVLGNKAIAGAEHVTVKSCTFVNCSAPKDKYWLEGRTLIHNSLFAGGTDSGTTKYKEGKANHWFQGSGVDLSSLFVNYNNGEINGDFHLKPEMAEDCLGDPEYTIQHDLDRQDYAAKLDGKDRPFVSGCYRYNSQQENKDLKKDVDVVIMNPLAVTTPEDVVDPYDGKISFREACSNLMAHVIPPRNIADQWPRITFELPSGSRYIQLEDIPIVIDDAKRTNPEGEDQTSWKRFTPIEIDGGVQGLTIRQNGAIEGPALKISSAGRLVNLTFDETPLEVGANRAAEVQDGTLADTTVYATNCVFKGGPVALPLVRASGAGTNGFDFTRCSFVNPSNATAAVVFDKTAKFRADFTCCTLAGFDKGVGTVVMPNAVGDLTFLSCTFALNGPASSDEAFADIWIGDGAKGGSVRLADCLFADGPDRALHRPDSVAAYGEIKTDRDEIHRTETVDNFAGSAKNALNSTTPERLLICGVSQLAFRPKHTMTARRGKAMVVFSDGVRISQPKTDIFGAPQEGARTSLGSRFVDDIETKSVTVDFEDDISDPYDDRISFREAIAYGLSDYRTFGKGGLSDAAFRHERLHELRRRTETRNRDRHRLLQGVRARQHRVDQARNRTAARVQHRSPDRQRTLPPGR